jgi:allantoin racemase
MGGRILVINPNSNEAFTAGIDRTVDRLRFSGGPEIRCVTLAEGPLGIENARHAADVIPHILKLIAREEENCDAFVVACFGDHGVVAAREMTKKAVIGFCEAGVAAALNAGERYGILTNMPEDANGELRLLRAHGLDARLAAIEAVGVAVTDLVDTPEVRQALLGGAERLRQSGAACVVLGCAGMSPFAPWLQRETGLRVIDPAIAAVILAIGAVASAIRA